MTTEARKLMRFFGLAWCVLISTGATIGGIVGIVEIHRAHRAVG
jgi:hypothetical protein